LAEHDFLGAEDTASQDDLDASQGADGAAGEMTEAGTPPADKEEAFFDPAQLAPELQAQWKSMQGAFTKRMQGFRAKEKELGQVTEKAALVDRFYKDPAYALQVMQQMAPQLGLTLGRGTGTPAGQPGNPATASPSTGLAELLTEKLGPDLAFLAPALAPAIEHVVEQRTRAAVAPLEQRAVAQTQAQRQAEEDALMAALDTEHPGWEEQYGADMQALDAFLASNALTHPKFGNKYQLYLSLLNPSAAKAGAVRDMQAAARNRVGTGRPGRPAASNVIDQIRQANLKDGWNAAWDLAIKNVDTLAEELRG
jgi:hypothetical protein